MGAGDEEYKQFFVTDVFPMFIGDVSCRRISGSLRRQTYQAKRWVRGWPGSQLIRLPAKWIKAAADRHNLR